MAFLHLTLVTRDVEQTSRFFEATFGWKRIECPPRIRVPAVWLAIAPNQEIHILGLPDFEPSPFEREYGRHLALSYPLAEFPSLRERLKKYGAEIVPSAHKAPPERFFFKDPNGYVFEVIAES